MANLLVTVAKAKAPILKAMPLPILRAPILKAAMPLPMGVKSKAKAVAQARAGAPGRVDRTASRAATAGTRNCKETL